LGNSGSKTGRIPRSFCAALGQKKTLPTFQVRFQFISVQLAFDGQNGAFPVYSY